MEKIINLPNRYGDKNYLKLLPRTDGIESKTYVLKLSNPYMRAGKVDNDKKFIDPSGGPMIIEGEKLVGTEEIVKSIDFTTGYGYTITFE